MIKMIGNMGTCLVITIQYLVDLQQEVRPLGLAAHLI